MCVRTISIVGLPDAKMMSINVGESVTDEFIPLLMEHVGIDMVSVRLKEPAPCIAEFKIVVIGAEAYRPFAGIKHQEAGYGYQMLEYRSRRNLV